MLTRPVVPTNGNDLSDIELVDRLLRNAPGAFDLFYRRHERLIYHCLRTRADTADVADLFQSFFERLVERDYRVLKLWQRGTSLPIYLSKVIRNFVVDFYRKKRWRENPVGGLSELEAHEKRREKRRSRLTSFLKNCDGSGFRHGPTWMAATGFLRAASFTGS